jgi:hypothetical protein
MPSVLDLIGDTPLVEVTQLDAAPCRLFLKLELGWHPTKARGLTPGGFRDQIRGYARDVTGQSM